jgi:hypothetical protein
MHNVREILSLFLQFNCQKPNSAAVKNVETITYFKKRQDKKWVDYEAGTLFDIFWSKNCHHPATKEKGLGSIA